MSLSEWQARFLRERVVEPRSGDEGVYFREQVFGAVDVLSSSLPELESTLGIQNFRFFVKEFLEVRQPSDALGTSLIDPFLEYLSLREEVVPNENVRAAITAAQRARSYSGS